MEEGNEDGYQGVLSKALKSGFDNRVLEEKNR